MIGYVLRDENGMILKGWIVRKAQTSLLRGVPGVALDAGIEVVSVEEALKGACSSKTDCAQRRRSAASARKPADRNLKREFVLEA